MVKYTLARCRGGFIIGANGGKYPLDVEDLPMAARSMTDVDSWGDMRISDAVVAPFLDVLSDAGWVCEYESVHAKQYLDAILSR